MQDLSRRVAELEQEVRKARKDAIDANARASSLDRRFAEMDQAVQKARGEAAESNARVASLDRKLGEVATLAKRLAAAEADVSALRKQVAQSLNRGREEARQDLEKEKSALLAELESVKQSRDSAGRTNDDLAAKAAGLLERVEKTAARNAEAIGRIEKLEGELAEAKAREADAAELRRAAEERKAEVERLQGERQEQDRQIEELKADVVEMHRRTKEPAEVGASTPATEERPSALDDLFPASSPGASEPEASPQPVSVLDPEPPPRESEPDAAPVEVVSVMDPGPEPEESPSEEAADSEPPAEVSSVMDPPPSTPEPEAVPASDELVAEAAKAAVDPKNLFGPKGDDGQPAYVLLEQLGRDALGSVHRAFDRASRNAFAVRFLPAQEGDWHNSKLEEEVQKLIGLPHPNLYQVLGCGRRGNEVYIETDLLQTEPLRLTTIREIPRICMIFRDLAEAVHYAHEEGALHGDVNADTLVLGKAVEGEGDQAYVKDFGLAYALELLATPPGAKHPPLALRNPAYLPPEQMKDSRGGLTVAADVYGLGAALYSVLSGKAPFEGKDARQVRSRVMMEEPPPLESMRQDVPMALAVVVRRAMAKEPGLRYPSAHQFAEGLTGFLEGKGTRILSRRPAPIE